MHAVDAQAQRAVIPQLRPSAWVRRPHNFCTPTGGDTGILHAIGVHWCIALTGTTLPYTTAELDTLATHCTAREDDATKIERQVQKSAAALLLSGQIGHQFDGLVTGASEKGTWVRIFTPPVEGKLVGGYAGLKVGDRVHVQLTHTDVQQGFIDFTRNTAPAIPASGPTGRHPSAQAIGLGTATP